MSGVLFNLDSVPDSMPEETKKWLEDHKPLWKTSPFDIPGPKTLEGGKWIGKIIEEAIKKYDVDGEEIMIGRSTVPPSDPSCLVYLSIARNNSDYQEFFRKGLKADGRWVHIDYMHHIKGSDIQKGTFDYRYGIAYL